MNLPNRRRLGAIALIVAGIGAFVAPFLLHAPSLQASNPKGPGTTNPGNQCTGSDCSPATSGGPPATNPPGHKHNLGDLLRAAQECNASNHGSRQSIIAKVNAAMHASDSTRTDNHLVQVIDHDLNTPAEQRHLDSACMSSLKDILNDLMQGS